MSVPLASFLPFICKAQRCSLFCYFFFLTSFWLTLQILTQNSEPVSCLIFLTSMSDVSKYTFDHIPLLNISSTFSYPSLILLLLPKLTFIFYRSMSQAHNGPLSPDILGSLRFCSPFPMLHTGNNNCIYALSMVPFPLAWIKISISLTILGYLGTIVTQEEKLHMATETILFWFFPLLQNITLSSANQSQVSNSLSLNS